MNQIQFFYDLLYNIMEFVNITYTHYVSKNLVRYIFITEFVLKTIFI